ncbi:MAG: TetR/AcrR family transcriptional regulator [Pseudomonadota bacterium]
MPRPIAKDHDDKRRHILKVAAEVFAREGIARASMNEVARACGTSKANIYHYYASKDDLIFGILDSYLSELRTIVAAVDLAPLSPPERLRALTRAILLAYEGMDNEHKIQSEGIPLLPAAQQTILKGYQRELVEVVSDVLGDLAPGKLGDDLRARRRTTMSVFGMLNWFYMWQPEASRAARIEYADEVAELTLSGIGGQAAAR